MTQLEASIRMRVRSGMLEQFKKQAVECIRQANDKDIGTLRYDWFLSRDGSTCEVREAYTDPEALLQHRANVGDAVDMLLKDWVDDRLMAVYSEPSLQLVRLADALGAGVTFYSLFKGQSGRGMATQMFDRQGRASRCLR